MMSLVPWEFTVRVFYSRFAPGFTPDSRSNSIALHHTRLDRFPHSFNANIVYGLTPSHSIHIATNRPFKTKPEPSAQTSLRVRLPQAHSQHRQSLPAELSNEYARFEDDPRRENPNTKTQRLRA